MHRAILVFSFLAAFVVHAAGAQHVVQGRVTDAETGAALEGATVVLADLGAGTATGGDGRFLLADVPPGTHRLVFSFVGYRSETRIVRAGEEDVRVDVALAPTAIETLPVTVTAKTQTSDLLSTPQAVSVVEERELDLRRGASAFDALEATAGVRLLRTGPAVAKPMVRGLTAQRVLVVHDGVRQEGQQWGDEHGPELGAFGLDRIEVVKGPASLLYGSDALGGVVHATTGDLFAYDGGLAGAVVLQGMSNTRLGGTHVRLGGRDGRFAYEARGTLKRAGSFSTPDGVVANTGVEQRDATLRAGWQRGRRSVTAAYERFDARLGLFEPGEGAGGPEGRFGIEEPYQHVVHDRVAAEAEVPLASGRLSIVSAWQQNRRREFGHHGEDDHGEDDRGAEETADPREEHEEGPDLFLRLSTATLDVRFHHHPVGRVYGTVGLSGLLQRNETLAEETLIPGAATLNGGAYVFEELLLSRVTISGGLRFDRRRLDVDENAALGVAAQVRSYDAFSGALGVAWQPAGGLSLAANAGRAWRAPVLIELFGEGVHEGTLRFERGDATLQPERSLSLDGTLRWLRRHAYFEATAFVNHIDDFIFPRRTEDRDPGSGYAVYRYDQTAARLWGGEVQVDIHPHPYDWVHLRLAGDVTRTRNRNTGQPLPFSPPPRLRAAAELAPAAAGPFADVRLVLESSWTARQDRTAPLEEATPGYVLWNAALSGDVRWGATTITPLLAVDNVFDAAYVSHLSRLRPYGVLSPGRNVRLQVRVAFD